LATAGTAITAFTVGGVFFAVFDLSWNTSLLITAVVASTDAAAVFAVLGGAGLPRRLLMTLEVESGFNDPMAVLLTVGLLEAAHGGFGAGGWLVLGIRQLAGGAIVGLLVGRIGAAALRRPGPAELSRSPVLAMAIGGFAYGLAAVLGGSGFLAVYIAGLLIGRDVRFRKAVEVFHKGLASTAQIGLFLMLGLLVFPSDLPAVAGKALLIAAVLVFVARPLAVMVCLAPFGFSRGERIVASWAGLRGGVPIVLATFPLTELHPDGHLIFNIVFFVVLLSATVQGLTIARLARRLGVTEPSTLAVAETIGPLAAMVTIDPQP
jgi:cell volume regulation protein A